MSATNDKKEVEGTRALIPWPIMVGLEALRERCQFQGGPQQLVENEKKDTKKKSRFPPDSKHKKAKLSKSSSDSVSSDGSGVTEVDSENRRIKTKSRRSSEELHLQTGGLLSNSFVQDLYTSLKENRKEVEFVLEDSSSDGEYSTTSIGFETGDESSSDATVDDGPID